MVLTKWKASRSCCVIQASVGERVTPTCTTRRGLAHLEDDKNIQKVYSDFIAKYLAYILY